MPSNKVPVRLHLRVSPRPVFTPSSPGPTPRPVASSPSVPTGLLIGGVVVGVFLLFAFWKAISGGGSGSSEASSRSDSGSVNQNQVPTQSQSTKQAVVIATNQTRPTPTLASTKVPAPIPIPTPNPPRAISLGTVLTGELRTPDQQDVYTFTLSQFIGTSIEAQPSGDLKSMNIIVFEPNGSGVQHHQPVCFDNSRATYMNFVPGSEWNKIHKIVISSDCRDSRGVGSYTISFWKYGSTQP